MSTTDKKPENVLYNIYVSYPPGSDPKSVNSKIRSAMANKDTAADVIRQLTDGKKPLVSEEQPAEKIQQLREYFAYMGLDIDAVEIAVPVEETDFMVNSTLEDEVEWVAEESFDFDSNALPVAQDSTAFNEEIDSIQEQLASLEEIEINQENIEEELIEEIEQLEEIEEIQEAEHPSSEEEADEYEYNNHTADEEYEEYEEYDQSIPTSDSGKVLKMTAIGVAAALLVGVGGYYLYNTFFLPKEIPIAQKSKPAKPKAAAKPTKTTTQKVQVAEFSGSLNMNHGSEDSLVYLNSQQKIPRLHNASSFYLFTLSLNPDIRGLESPLMDIPNALKIRMLPDFIDTLIDFGQIERAEEVLQKAAQTNQEFAVSQHFATAKAHLLTHQSITEQSLVSALQKHIDSMDESGKVKALLYVATTFAANGQDAKPWLQKAQSTISAIDADSNSEKAHLQNLLHINQAAVLSFGNKVAIEHGMWAQAKTLDQQLQTSLLDNNKPVEQFAIALLALRTAGLMNDAKAYQKAQTILMNSANKLDGLKDNQTALRFWQTHMNHLPDSLNHDLAKTMQPVVQAQLPIADEAITLYQVCRALNERDCYVKISERAFGNPRLNAKLVEDFGLQIYIYNILTASRQARKAHQFTESEQWLRRAAYELL